MIYKQNKELEQLLLSNKKLTPSGLSAIQSYISSNKIPRVPIFRMTPMMHYLIYFLRTQVLLYTCVDLGVTAYNVYTKWHREKIRTKLVALSGLSILAVIGMVKGSAAVTRRAVREITYFP